MEYVLNVCHRIMGLVEGIQRYNRQGQGSLQGEFDQRLREEKDELQRELLRMQKQLELPEYDPCSITTTETAVVENGWVLRLLPNDDSKEEDGAHGNEKMDDLVQTASAGEPAHPMTFLAQSDLYRGTDEENAKCTEASRALESKQASASPMKIDDGETNLGNTNFDKGHRGSLGADSVKAVNDMHAESTHTLVPLKCDALHADPFLLLESGLQLISLPSLTNNDARTLTTDSFETKRKQKIGGQFVYSLRLKAGCDVPGQVCVRIPLETPMTQAIEYEHSGDAYVVRKYGHNAEVGADDQLEFTEIRDTHISFFGGIFVEVVVDHFCQFLIEVVASVHKDVPLPWVRAVHYLKNESKRDTIVDVFPFTGAVQRANVQLTGGGVDFQNRQPDYGQRQEETLTHGQYLRVAMVKMPFVERWPGFEACVLHGGRFVVTKYGTVVKDLVIPYSSDEVLAAREPSSIHKCG
ncbi:hypothetical protein AB1Y20_016828 [Prymnesium parvum]|uniref:Uncharacterized protein n=1 Tax=Prymnesium parvum TaxID=97485 RepID=A0AB34ICD5_PRYPA